ncbi:hypothetical protein D3C75_1030090 [compost metagenome]
MKNPLRENPFAISLTCLFALAASLTVPRPTGLEEWAFGIGLLTSIVFWISCVIYASAQNGEQPCQLG